MKDKTNEFASKYLGKKVSGSLSYDPSLLVVVPRSENRKQYNIEEKALPFNGFDIWHAYEFSCLTRKGVPITRVIKLKYNCSSKYIIESKSLKLYLNSFNMTHLGDSIDEALRISKEYIIKDLSEKLQTNVSLEFLEPKIKQINLFENYNNIMTYVDEAKLELNKYKEAPEVLKTDNTDLCKIYKLFFDSLRSNCRVTHQPDFGNVFICYESKKHIDEASLIQYLTSFRSEYHFHEECCEMIFKRLSDILDENDKLMVCALYTRRGGIDICPVRYTSNFDIYDYDNLLNTKNYASYFINQ